MAQIPDGIHIQLVDNVRDCDDVLMRTLEKELRGDASSTPNGPVIIGLDAEWNRGSDSADLVQLASKYTVVLIRLYRMRECPIRLQKLLASPALMKVGCRVSGDITRILKKFNLLSEITPRSIANLGTLCKDLGFVEKAQEGLQTLCSVVLNKFLPKEGSIRVNSYGQRII
ncbi:hypothetical protein V1504DRAFT_64730 [Lipomyces starkeyi]